MFGLYISALPRKDVNSDREELLLSAGPTATNAVVAEEIRTAGAVMSDARDTESEPTAI